MDIEKVPWDHEKVIIRLIENDLIYARLLHGLGEMSLNPDNCHYMNLDELILELLGINAPIIHQTMQEVYHRMTDEAIELKLTQDNKKFYDLAKEIYDELVK